MKAKLSYWIPTGLIALFMAASAIPDVLRVEGALTVIHHLGYPDYFLTLIGVAKLLGVAALLAPVPRTLREWAYAGFTFDLLGAAFSHGSVGDPMGNVMTPLVALAVLQVSYWAWRRRGDRLSMEESENPPARSTLVSSPSAARRNSIGMR